MIKKVIRLIPLLTLAIMLLVVWTVLDTALIYFIPCTKIPVAIGGFFVGGFMFDVLEVFYKIGRLK